MGVKFIPSWVYGETVEYTGFHGAVVANQTLKAISVSPTSTEVQDTLSSEETDVFDETFTPGTGAAWGFQFWVDPFDPIGSIVGPEGEAYYVKGTEVFDGVDATVLNMVPGLDATGQVIYETSTGLILMEATNYLNNTIEQYFSAILNAPSSVDAPDDFNGNGASDLLWEDKANHSIVAWSMSGGKEAAETVVGTLAEGTSVVGEGDFSGDGTSDILIENAASGALAIWKIANGKRTGVASLNGLAPSAGWKVAGVGDFAGDGVDSVLWSNAKTGAVVDWTIVGDAEKASAKVGTLPKGFAIVGIGNFFDNAAADALLENAKTGALEIWRISSGKLAGTASLGELPTGDKFVGVGVFSAPGTSDILFENSSGALAFWAIDNGAVASLNSLDISVPSGFEVLGAGNYDGGGLSDVLIYDPKTGASAVGLVSGGHIADWTAAGDALSPATWKLLGDGPHVGKVFVDGRRQIPSMEIRDALPEDAPAACKTLDRGLGCEGP